MAKNKDMTPRDQMVRAFVLGMITMLCMISLFQDWMGLEGYIEYLRDHWFDIWWVLWVLPILYNLLALYSMYRKPGIRSEVADLIAERISKAVMLILKHGPVDAAHHKQWAMDQALKVMLGKGYNSFMSEYNVGGEYQDWDEGTPP